MLAGYIRVSKADGSQTTDLQLDALTKAGVSASAIFEDLASGKRDDRPQLIACLKSLNAGDTLIVWKLDRLGRSLRHLINTVHELTGRGIGFRVLTSSMIDTTTPEGKLIFGIFAALAEFERDLLVERTKAGLIAARERGRIGGRPHKMTLANIKLAKERLANGEAKISDLSRDFKVSRQTLYRRLAPSA